MKLARKGQTVERPQDVLKNPLVLEFLGMDERASYSESDLEHAIISNEWTEEFEHAKEPPHAR